MLLSLIMRCALRGDAPGCLRPRLGRSTLEFRRNRGGLQFPLGFHSGPRGVPAFGHLDAGAEGYSPDHRLLFPRTLRARRTSLVAAGLEEARSAASARPWHFPRGAQLVIGFEFCERVGFYSMVSLLALFLSASRAAGGFAWE